MLRSGQGGLTPPPLTVSLTVKYPGFFDDFPNDDTRIIMLATLTLCNPFRQCVNLKISISFPDLSLLGTDRSATTQP